MTDQERAQAITNSCQCHEGYSSRKLIDPQCAFHAYANEIADAFAAVRQEERERLQEAWRLSWDCSRDPGHTIMNEAIHGPLEPPENIP